MLLYGAGAFAALQAADIIVEPLRLLERFDTLWATGDAKLRETLRTHYGG
jgi:hypothetical protein